ncbi:O-antigen ligase family protein [Alteriqipengyuania sp.]|uniref:O-antigen ligase family protein n=1 Tax=Alteriqipengyuania sp. TaxID=2800692 RepID=UPI003512224B
MARRKTRTARLREDFRENWQLVTLCGLMIATFLMGGASRGDVMSLIILRPLAVVCLGLGLYGLTARHWRAYRLPLAIIGAITALILVHLIPLPPFVWANLPGREIVVEAGELAELDTIWRPLAMVPFRGWNAFYAMLVPAAAMVLMVQVAPERQRVLLYVILGATALATVIGIVQAGSGFSRSLFLYRVTSTGAPAGLFANRNHFAALLCIAIPALALIASRAREPRKNLVRALCAGGALMAIFMIFAAGSRAGLAMAFVGLLGGWAVWEARPEQIRRRKSGPTWVLPAAGTAFSLLVVAFLAVIFGRADALERISTSDVAEENRLRAWEVTAGSLWDYFPVGSGIGSFVEIFKIHEPVDLLSFGYWNHAHNDWLEWLLEGGIPAAILMIVAVVAWARGSLYLWARRTSGRHSIQLGLFGAFAILILGLWSFVDYPLRVPSLASLAAIAAVWMTTPRVVAAKAYSTQEA